MRAVEERWIREQRREEQSALELHRLAYVYYLNRLEERVRAGAPHAELVAIAVLCRRERAAYLQTTEAEADAMHGGVIDVARGLAEMETR